MSLRDELLKAGLVSKKDVRRANRDKKKTRKQEQGSRRRKRAEQAEAEAARQAALEAERQERLACRQELDEAREEHERVNRIRQTILGNRLGAKGHTPFWVRSPDGRHLHRMSVTDRIAFDLRCGHAAVAVLLEPDREPEYYVISRRAALKLEEIAPEQVVFLVTDTAGLSHPEEQFLQQEWEPSLRPHRQREGDQAG